jgi:hypothetical protein
MLYQSSMKKDKQNIKATIHMTNNMCFRYTFLARLFFTKQLNICNAWIVLPCVTLSLKSLGHAQRLHIQALAPY